MVFSNLPYQEKDAFFSLLDEYFQSRPELASALKSRNTGSSTSPSNDTAETESPPPPVAGRVAAAASAFNFANRSTGSSSGAGAGSTSPPVKHGFNSHTAPGGLVTGKKWGDVDTSSGKSMVVSGLLTKKQPPSGPPIVPSAFPAKKNNFAPPPMHRKEPEPEPEPEPEEEEDEEVQGEWAEALYDYEPADPNDLGIRANQRIWITERTTDDWWTGQVDGTGKSGLFPATYVKLL